MKLLLLTTLSIAFIAILGMFYWMYKARNGELNLSTKSWHYKLKHWISIFEGIWGLIQLPFILLYNLVKIPFEFIFKVYTDRCPPIKWED